MGWSAAFPVSRRPGSPSCPILGVVERHNEHRVRMAKSISPERRASTRFALALEVRYVASDRRAPVEMGSGRTIDLSSSGLSFTADRPLPTGQRLGLVLPPPYRAGSKS